MTNHILDKFQKKIKSARSATKSKKSRSNKAQSIATMDDDNWSNKAKSLANQQLNLDIIQNIERRRTIATEHRHRKAKMFKDDPKHPLAVT